MSIPRYKKWLLGGAVAFAALLPLGASSAAAAESAAGVPMKTLTYRGETDQTRVQEVRWGRRYYGGPGRYYAPRYYSGYRGGYYAPYGGYYGRGYYGPGYYGPRYGYYGRGYYGGGVRVGGMGVFWR